MSVYIHLIMYVYGRPPPPQKQNQQRACFIYVLRDTRMTKQATWLSAR